MNENLKPNEPSLVFESRLRERIVVTPSWFLRVGRVMAGLHLMADGMFPDENGQLLPQNPHIRKMLIENYLYDHGFYEPLKED